MTQEHIHAIEDIYNELNSIIEVSNRATSLNVTETQIRTKLAVKAIRNRLKILGYEDKTQPNLVISPVMCTI